MAHSLSLVGERWSLLIVRELLHGPKRYTDLVNGLPGIGTNILAARLRDLEGGGVGWSDDPGWEASVCGGANVTSAGCQPTGVATSPGCCAVTGWSSVVRLS